MTGKVPVELRFFHAFSVEACRVVNYGWMMSQDQVLHVASKVFMPTYAPLPTVPARAIGSVVYDHDGRDYIDLGGGIAVASLGHNPPKVRQAIDDQLDKLWHASNVFATEPATALAERLVDLSFADRVFFSNSGSEANEAALKLARRHAYNNGHADKFEIVALKGAFHGRSFFTVSAGGTDSYREGFGPTPEGISHVEPNDSDALAAVVSNATAAVIVEPIQGEAGVRLLTRDFLNRARALCDEYDALLIFDEVQTGAGRTGTLFAYQQLGVIPDVLTSAKGLGGGFPIGATLAAGPCAQALTRGTHGSTFGGNPLACAAASAVLTEITTPTIEANVADRHHQIMAELSGFNDTSALFSEIRGRGLLIGAELTPEYAGQAKALQLTALDAGVITLVAGPDVLRLAPPLNISGEDLATGLTRLGTAIAKFKTS